jgi:phosphomannomutase/phosphoglucomutase
MSVFKAYDIRGLAHSELDAEFAERLGRALATHLDAKSVAVASDIRESGPELHDALLRGLNLSGADVLDLGITTTGVLYRATVDLPVDASIVITASHNPPEYNGFKICNGSLPMAGNELQELKETFDKGDFKDGNGIIKNLPNFENEYLETIVRNAGMPQRKMKIAIDCGNAVPGPLTIRLMEKLGVELIPVHCNWDNKFPNHPPDPTRPENMKDLSKAVLENNAEFGIGMDGDGDRIGVVDESGVFIHPDRLMTIFAKDILRERKGGTDAERTVFFDVKCSMALEEVITSAGGIPVMVRTGHSFMKRELRNNPDSPLAGEMSGHFFLNDRWPGFDDSLYNTARLLEIIAREPSPESGGPVFSDWFADLPNYASTGEAKVPLDRDREETMDFVTNAFADMKKSTVDGVRVRYSDGWYLCRPSNTEPILVMRAEANSKEGLEKIKEDVENRLGSEINLRKFHEA